MHCALHTYPAVTLLVLVRFFTTHYTIRAVRLWMATLPYRHTRCRHRLLLPFLPAHAFVVYRTAHRAATRVAAFWFRLFTLRFSSYFIRPCYNLLFVVMPHRFVAHRPRSFTPPHIFPPRTVICAFYRLFISPPHFLHCCRYTVLLLADVPPFLRGSAFLAVVAVLMRSAVLGTFITRSTYRSIFLCPLRFRFTHSLIRARYAVRVEHTPLPSPRIHYLCVLHLLPQLMPRWAADQNAATRDKHHRP